MMTSSSANPRFKINVLILEFMDRHLWGFVFKPQGQSKAQKKGSVTLFLARCIRHVARTAGV